MFRHVVMFRWKDEATDAQQQAVRNALAALPDQIPQIRAYHLGADLRLNPENFHLVLIADFATQDDYLLYRDHPAHQRVIAEYIHPIAAQLARVQYETTE